MLVKSNEDLRSSNQKLFEIGPRTEPEVTVSEMSLKKEKKPKESKIKKSRSLSREYKSPER